LESLRICGNDVCGLEEFVGGLEFAVGMDDLGPSLALGLGLLGDRPDHILRQVHLFHLDELDLDAPGVGVLVDDFLKPGIKFFALRKKLVEINLAERAAERCLGELGRCVQIILDFDDRPDRVDDTEIKDGAHFDRNIIFSDDILGRYLHGD